MGKKGRKCLQTNPTILKTTHLTCHAWVHAPKFDTVISFHKLTNKMLPSFPLPSSFFWLSFHFSCNDGWLLSGSSTAFHFKMTGLAGQLWLLLKPSVFSNGIKIKWKAYYADQIYSWTLFIWTPRGPYKVSVLSGPYCSYTFYLNKILEK